MNKSSISEQLKHDYPDYDIYLDSNRMMLVADNHEMRLLSSSISLQTVNIFSRSGRSFYQAITQLLCSNYDVFPEEGSYASTLIILKKDLNKYKVQKLAKEWGIGFLETGEDVVALEVNDGIERDFLLESDVVDEELKDNELFPILEGLTDDENLDDWAELEEINFNKEIAYLEKGIEFVTAMEEVESIDNKRLNEIEDLEEHEDLESIEEKIDKSEPISNKKGILNSILKILKL